MENILKTVHNFLKPSIRNFGRVTQHRLTAKVHVIIKCKTFAVDRIGTTGSCNTDLLAHRSSALSSLTRSRARV